MAKRDLKIKRYTEKNGTKVIQLPQARMGETMFCGMGAKRAVILSKSRPTKRPENLVLVDDLPEIDYRKNQKVVLTLVLEDKGQDFTEIDVLENGVILGNSIMFADGRISMLGVGRLDGLHFVTKDQFVNIKMTPELFRKEIKGSHIYIKETAEKRERLPWDAKTLNYKIVGFKKPVSPDRFISNE